MPTRRSSSRVALLAALAVVGSPGVGRGQGAASLDIDRALFMVATKGPDGKWAVRETDRVPLRPRDACYGWRLHFSNNAPGEVAWRGEFTLPGTPGKDPTLLVTKKSEKPLGGWIGDGWCVTKGDPTGEHVIKVYVRDSLARTFRFSSSPRRISSAKSRPAASASRRSIPWTNSATSPLGASRSRPSSKQSWPFKSSIVLTDEAESTLALGRSK